MLNNNVGKAKRDAVLRRDRYRCRYCKMTLPPTRLTIDHLTPLSKGGSNANGNLVACCQDCNSDKDSLTFDEYMRLLLHRKKLRAEKAAQQLPAIEGVEPRALA